VTLTLRPGEPLTAREKDILGLVAQGRSNDAIAEALGISRHTVHEHVRAVLAKLGAANRTHAVAIAYQRRLLTVSGDAGMPQGTADALEACARAAASGWSGAARRLGRDALELLDTAAAQAEADNQPKDAK
jgi:DNA-binding CsgD family transcriptional regulator